MTSKYDNRAMQSNNGSTARVKAYGTRHHHHNQSSSSSSSSSSRRVHHNQDQLGTTPTMMGKSNRRIRGSNRNNDDHSANDVDCALSSQARSRCSTSSSGGGGGSGTSRRTNDDDGGSRLTLRSSSNVSIVSFSSSFVDEEEDDDNATLWSFIQRRENKKASTKPYFQSALFALSSSFCGNTSNRRKKTSKKKSRSEKVIPLIMASFLILMLMATMHEYLPHRSKRWIRNIVSTALLDRSSSPYFHRIMPTVFTSGAMDHGSDPGRDDDERSTAIVYLIKDQVDKEHLSDSLDLLFQNLLLRPPVILQQQKYSHRGFSEYDGTNAIKQHLSWKTVQVMIFYPSGVFQRSDLVSWQNRYPTETLGTIQWIEFGSVHDYFYRNSMHYFYLQGLWDYFRGIATLQQASDDKHMIRSATRRSTPYESVILMQPTTMMYSPVSSTVLSGSSPSMDASTNPTLAYRFCMDAYYPDHVELLHKLWAANPVTKSWSESQQRRRLIMMQQQQHLLDVSCSYMNFLHFGVVLDLDWLLRRKRKSIKSMVRWLETIPASTILARDQHGRRIRKRHAHNSTHDADEITLLQQDVLPLNVLLNVVWQPFMESSHDDQSFHHVNEFTMGYRECTFDSVVTPGIPTPQQEGMLQLGTAAFAEHVGDEWWREYLLPSSSSSSSSSLLSKGAMCSSSNVKNNKGLARAASSMDDVQEKYHWRRWKERMRLDDEQAAMKEVVAVFDGIHHIVDVDGMLLVGKQ